MRNLLFYKFVELNDLDNFREELLELCESLDLKGKVLIAKEGINGCVSGTIDNTDRFVKEFRTDLRFSDVEFKEGLVFQHNFKRMIVKIRDEIITAKFNFDLKSKAEYIEPKELKKLLDSDEEVVLLDARNNYESDMGKFKGAIAPDIDFFSEWPQAVEDLEDLKHKQIVTYCTGGIRCEKASAYLKEKGFKNVKQLHGGILNYGKECGSKHWEGKCFVFDRRIGVDIDNENPVENADMEMQLIGY